MTSRLLCIYGLGLAFCSSLPMAARGQAATASRETRATLDRIKHMTELNTVAARDTPAARTAPADTSIRPFPVAAAQRTTEIQPPVATTVFGEDAYRPPESWTRRAYPSLIYFHEVEKGGHFAAWEQPQLFAAELRKAFKSVR